MKNFRFYAAMGLIACVFLVLAGCDSVSTEPKLQTGDIDDTEFEQIDGLFGEGFTDMSSSMLDLTFQLIDSIPVPASIRKPAAFASAGDFDNLEFEYSYNALTYWHVFAVSASASEDDGDGGLVTFSFSGIDSVRFTNADGYLQYPDESVTAAAIRWHFGADVTAPEGEFNYDSDASIDLTGEYQGDFVVNGSSSDDLALLITDDEASCTANISINQDFTDVYIPTSGEGNECPPSGRIDVDASIDIECDDEAPAGYENLSINGNWDIAYIFDDGTVTITYSDGTTQWTIVEDCGSDEVYSPRIPPLEQ